MTTSYPYDSYVHRAVARLLYRLLPALYRVKDLGPSVPRDTTGSPTDPANVQARFLRDLHELTDDVFPPEVPENLPQGTADLYRLLHVLAAPLAVLRQNVQELHADLFIDRCDDAMLPLLASQIGARLVFKNADEDRDDLRNTVAWRRRKGTRTMLEDMASTLLDRQVVTQEGWGRLIMSQHVNLLRPERVMCDVRSPELADTCAGPYDAAFHALDARRPTAHSGRYHPRHITHWTHATTLFPVRRGTPAAWHSGFDAPDPDRRYTFHPTGADAPLRVRADAIPVSPTAMVVGSPVAAYEPPTDRVPTSLFAAHPELYFDDGSGPSSKFSVRILGLPAAVTSSQSMGWPSSTSPASGILYNSPVGVELLRRGEGAWSRPVEVMVCRVPFTGGSDTPDVASAVALGGLVIRAAAEVPITHTGVGTLPDAVAMIRLRPESGTAAYFPGAVLAVVGATDQARLASEDPQLAQMGFLCGALHVEMPATWVWSTRWFYLSADGSLYDAQSLNEPGDDPTLAPAVNQPVLRDGAKVSLLGALRATGPGPSWPPTSMQSSSQPFTALPPPLGQGPVFVHAARALDGAGAPASGTMRLVFFCVTSDGPGDGPGDGPAPEPFMRLSWDGALNPAEDPHSTWEVLSDTGDVLPTAAAVLSRWQDIAMHMSGAFGLHLECGAGGLVLPPCEVAFTDVYGQATLLYLPELRSKERSPGFATSKFFQVMGDGSTRGVGGGDEDEGEDGDGDGDENKGGRYSLGPAIPLRDKATLRRREVHGRRLCAWHNETEAERLAGTRSGRLDVDVEHGLFAMSSDDSVPTYPTYPTSVTTWAPVAPVTVNWQDGFTDHIGARTEERGSELDTWIRTPTRIVSSTGRIPTNDPTERRNLPRYATLAKAFEGITASPHTESRMTPSGAVDVVVEVVEFDDSATYEEGTITWPAGMNSLTVQAAEGERPVLRTHAAMGVPAPDHGYEELILRGLSFDAGNVTTPSAKQVTVQFCSSARAGCRWTLGARLDGTSEILITRCNLDSVALSVDVSGEAVHVGGTLRIERSVLSASTASIGASGIAINAREARLELERCTVSKGEGGADTHCMLAKVLEASEVLFTHPIAVEDRFSGCVRYSRVAPDSVTPRRFGVTEERPLFVSLDPADAAHLRLTADAPEAILHGAEDGGEIGAFHDTGLTRRAEGVLRRLMEFTPAGLITGVIRQD